MRSFQGSRFGGSGGTGGGSSISNPGVAYVQTNGDDTTAEIGNPAKPYLEVQAAFNAGARSFMLGADLAGDLTLDVGDLSSEVSGELRLFFSGQGPFSSTCTLDLRVSMGAWVLRLDTDGSVKFPSVTIGALNGYCELYANQCAITTLNTVNTDEEGSPILLYGRMTFCDVETDSLNADALSIAYFSMIEGVARFSPPS